MTKESAQMAAWREDAPAKINLTLKVKGKRPDGYHEISSDVAFVRWHDTIIVEPAERVSIDLSGPWAKSLKTENPDSNLVMRAWHAFNRLWPQATSRIHIIKRIPVAAGLGGGSADGAAMLRGLAKAQGIPLHDTQLMAIAASLGSDVPVCLHAKPCHMQGRGELLGKPLNMNKTHVILLNPGVALSTRDVFAAWKPHHDGDGPNDLLAPAASLAPVITDAIQKLMATIGCQRAWMTGSGATVIGAFESCQMALNAAKVLIQQNPSWWVRKTEILPSPHEEAA